MELRGSTLLVEDTKDCPFCLSLRTYYHVRESRCFLADPYLDCGWSLRSHSFHRPNMLSAHDHRFPFRGTTVALN